MGRTQGIINRHDGGKVTAPEPGIRRRARARGVSGQRKRRYHSRPVEIQGHIDGCRCRGSHQLSIVNVDVGRSGDWITAAIEFYPLYLQSFRIDQETIFIQVELPGARVKVGSLSYSGPRKSHGPEWPNPWGYWSSRHHPE